MSGLEKLGWLPDAERATLDARSRPKPKDAAPHHLRCEHYRATAGGAFQRCRLSDGHPGDHEPSAADAPPKEGGA